MKSIILFASLLVLGFSEIQSSEDSARNGEVLYNQYCTPCHTLDMTIIGPGLRDIHMKRDSAWLYKWTTKSKKLIKSGDTAAVAIFNKHHKILQPDFKLSPVQVNDIYEYIKSAPRE